MPFTTPAYEAIRDAILRDIRAELADADVSSDSDNYVRASSAAAAIEGIYQHQAWLYRQIWPDTADSDGLAHHAGEHGLARKPAVAASGTMHITGTVGALLSAGSLARHATGIVVVTTLDTPISGDGSADVHVVAQTAGIAADGLTGSVTLTGAPLGIDAVGALADPLSGGVDVESDAALLERLLTLIRRPPAGGNRYDYAQWAQEVPGVASAYVYPLRRGLGTVDVVIVAPDGLPGVDLIAAVQAHIDDVRPVTAWDTLVFAPTVVSVDVTAQVKLADGYALADVQAAAAAQLAAAFATLAPGDVWYATRSEAIISDLPGVLDRLQTAPAANVAPTVDDITVEWARLGDVTLTEMA